MFRTFCVSLALNLCRIVMLAQSPANAQWAHVRMFDRDDGFPEKAICLKQTSDGYLWIGATDGLVRFDGSHFKKFDIGKFSRDWRAIQVNDFMEETNGMLWIGTSQGLFKYQHGAISPASNIEVRGEEVVRMAPSKSGGFWVQSGPWPLECLAHYEGGQSSPAWYSRHFGKIECFKENRGGGLDVITENGWIELSRSGEIIRTNIFLDTNSPGWFSACPSQIPGGFWCGTLKGPVFVRDQGVTPLNCPVDGASVDAIFESGRGGVWLSVARKGLYFWDQVTWNRLEGNIRTDGISANRSGFVTRQVLPAHEVRSGRGLLVQPPVIGFAEDHEGNVWVARDRLYQISPTPVKLYLQPNGRPIGLSSVCEDQEQTVWAANAHDLTKIVDGQICTLDRKDEYGGDGRTVLLPSCRGGCWLERDRSLFKCSNGILAPIDAVNSLTGKLTGLFEDKAGRLWIGTSDGIVVMFDGKVLELGTNDSPSPLLSAPLPTSESLPSAAEASRLWDVRCMLEDRSGKIWFGMENHGVATFDCGVMTFPTDQWLSRCNVHRIQEDESGAIWIATDSGLIRFKDGRAFLIGQTNGLVENRVNELIKDDQECFWLLGDRGIYRIPRKDLDEVADGRKPPLEPFQIDDTDGLRSSDLGTGLGTSACKSHDGQIWFTSRGNLFSLNPRVLPLRERATRTVIEQVKAGGRVVVREDGFSASATGNLDPIHLSPGDGRVIDFKFTCGISAGEHNVKYRYRLAGLDDEWRDETEDGSARFYGLKPGRYCFEVMASSRHGAWNGTPAGFAFVIPPLFWQRWIFYFGCACGAGLLLGAHAYRLHWQRRLLKLEEQRALSNERARIARDLHDDIGASLTGLALQLEAAKARSASQKEDLGILANEARTLTDELRELAWATNPRCDNTGSLAAFMTEYAERFCKAAGIQCALDIPLREGCVPVSARVRHELLTVLKESLANVLKHSRASMVSVELKVRERELQLIISDNGRGFDSGLASAGQGIRNLRERVEKAGGTITIDSAMEAGTRVKVNVPFEAVTQSARSNGNGF